MGRINQKGATLVETSVASGIIVLMALSSASMFKYYKDRDVQVRIKQVATQVRQNIMGVLTNQEAWIQTVNRAPTASKLKCLVINTTTPCKQYDSQEPIDIYDAQGNLIVNSAANAGFDQHGVACTGFNGTAGQGNDNCPLRVVVKWTAACARPYNVDDCRNPQNLLSATFIYNGSSANANIAADISKFNFKNAPRMIQDEASNPVTICANKGKVFMPIWPINSGAVDADGCIPISELD